jgi:hypothetical protein
MHVMSFYRRCQGEPAVKAFCNPQRQTTQYIAIVRYRIKPFIQKTLAVTNGNAPEDVRN